MAIDAKKKNTPTQWNKAKSVTLQTTAQHEPGKNCDRLNKKVGRGYVNKCSKQHVVNNLARRHGTNHCVRHHTLSCGRPNIKQQRARRQTNTCGVQHNQNETTCETKRNGTIGVALADGISSPRSHRTPHVANSRTTNRR